MTEMQSNMVHTFCHDQLEMSCIYVDSYQHKWTVTPQSEIKLDAFMDYLNEKSACTAVSSFAEDYEASQKLFDEINRDLTLQALSQSGSKAAVRSITMRRGYDPKKAEKLAEMVAKLAVDLSTDDCWDG